MILFLCREKKYFEYDAVEITSFPPTAPSASPLLPRGFLFPQIEASMRYSSSFNSEIYSAAHRLIQFINRPQYIKRFSIDLLDSGSIF